MALKHPSSSAVKADEEQQLTAELLFSAVKAVDETLAVSGSLPASNSDWLQAVGPNNTSEDWILQAIGVPVSKATQLKWPSMPGIALIPRQNVCSCW